MSDSVETFSVWDYLVFSIVLLISAGIGLYHAFAGGKQRTTQASGISIVLCLLGSYVVVFTSMFGILSQSATSMSVQHPQVAMLRACPNMTQDVEWFVKP